MNPLMTAMQKFNNVSQNMNQLKHIIQLLQKGNPDQIATHMMQNNPQFRKFVESNKGKTPEQISKEYGIDLNQIKNMI